MSAQAQVLPNGTYNVANQSSALLWDDPNSATASLTKVVLWPSDGGTNQQWSFTLQSDGYYQILNQVSGLALNNPASSTTSGTQLIQYPWSPVTSNAEWSVKPAASGAGWIVTNRQSGLVVGPAGNTQNTYIDQETAAGSAQVWMIGNCAAGAITPYISTPVSGWLSATSASVSSTSGVDLGPQAATGTWSWTGPNGYTASTREIDNIPLTANATNYFVAQYTSTSGCTSTETFAITVGSPAGTGLVVNPIANQSYPEAAFTVSATSNSPAAITYSVQSGPATISGNQVTVFSGGTVVIAASQAASGTYAAATATASFAVSTAMSKTLAFSKTGSAVSAGPSSDTPNFNFIDNNGQFFLQNAYSQYDTTPGDHIWDFYTGANELDSSLALSSTNSQYNTQTLCTTSSPVYTDYYTNSGQSPGPGAYTDGNFCDVIGVWVDPDTSNWYGIVHNEIYPNSFRVDALSYAISTDHGATWTQKTPIATSAYGISDSSVPYHDYGDGDPRFLVDTASGYFYILYSTRIQDSSDTTRLWWRRVTRAPISQKFAPSSWQKYYNGGWTQSPGIVWTCDANKTPCANGLTAADLESNIGADGEPSKSQQVKWPASARSASDLNTFTGSVWGTFAVSWNVYLQKYVVTSIGTNEIDFYTTSDISSQAWTFAGSVPYTNGGSWYNWSLDSGNLSATQVTGKSFYMFCVISCSAYGSEYTPFSVSFNAGAATPTYYTGYNGATSSSNTYVIAHTSSASATADASNKWTFVPVGDGFYYVQQGGQNLQVADGNSGRAWGASVSLAAPAASSTSAPELSRQQWRFEKITAIAGVAPAVPQYRLINRYSGLALSFTSTAFDSQYFSYAVTAPARDWDAAAGSTYGSWHVADQELIFVAQ